MKKLLQLKGRWIGTSVMALLAFIFSFNASAYDFEVDGIYYNILDENSVEVTNEVSVFQPTESYQGEIIIPETVIYNGKDYIITSISGEAFFGCRNLITVSIPASVISIGTQAFNYCYNLGNIYVAENNINFVSVEGVLYDKIEGSLLQIPGAKVSITLPEFVTSINGTIPFNGCNKLENIFVNENNLLFNSNDGILYDKEFETLIKCPLAKQSATLIPNSVTTIQQHAFYECYKLMAVDLPNSLIVIESYAFNSCSSLTQLTIPDSVISIGDSSFSNCRSLISLTIPESVLKIGRDIFGGCYSLENIFVNENNPNYTSVEGVLYDKNISILIRCPENKSSILIPETVSKIGDSAFYGNNLTELIIPNSVTELGHQVFNYCSSLVNIILSNSLTEIPSNTFDYCTSLENLELGNSIEIINSNAIQMCSSLTSLTLPETIRILGSGILTGCESLIYITCLANQVPLIGQDCFNGISSDAILYVPAESVNDYKDSQWSDYFKEIKPIDEEDIPETFYADGYYFRPLSKNTVSLSWSNNMAYGEMIIPSTVEYEGKVYTVIEIGNSSFDGAPITSLTIPNTITTIGNAAFRSCSFLQELNLPDSIERIGNSAFEGCFELTHLTLGNSIEMIGESAFSWCPISEIFIPQSVYEIGERAFSGVLNNIFVDENNQNYSSIDGVLVDKEKTTLLQCPVKKGYTEYPSSIIHIGNYAFQNNSLLKSIVIPNHIETIGAYSFYNCNLDLIEIPQSVSSIGRNAFLVGLGLRGIYVDENNQNYSSIDGVLYDKKQETLILCPSYKKEINIPTTVLTINENAFYQSLIEEINLPNSLIEIGDNAFELSKIRRIIIPSSVLNIGKYAFLNCSQLEECTLEEGILNIGEWCFSGCSFKQLSLPHTLTNIEGFTFCSCELMDVIIPETITSIGPMAFDSYSLYNVTCLAVEPPSLGYDCFWDGAHKNYRNLYVKQEVIDKYKDSEWAQYFYAIIPIAEEGEIIPVNEIIIEGGPNISMPIDSTRKLRAFIQPGNATYQEIIWSSSDESIASIDEDGTVTSYQIGEVIITATLLENPEIYASCSLKVEEYTGIKGIEADKNGFFRIFNMSGNIIKVTQDPSEINELPKGLYIINGRKVVK